eukprot:CAMPEP_0119510682 /NCGR_PEP_ID=MMETSP1344-20130328/29586_1 /TAXON_ID=236787 /ORGANISM="Florenciella parvula, Strain CCMP2471" /LENGTH=81 /DNA_ID=CAMNT_0007547625 /DNA_START=49 /DNA_END=291 /DNA_ORIENTATION=-
MSPPSTDLDYEQHEAIHHACLHQVRVGFDKLVEPKGSIKEGRHREHHGQFQAQNLPVWQAVVHERIEEHAGATVPPPGEDD